MAGHIVITDGQVVATNTFNDYMIGQSIRKFSSASQRDSDLATPVEGDYCYLADTDTMQVYNGSAWVSYGTAAAWNSYTPAWKDGSGGTNLSIGNGTLTGGYFKLGRLVIFRMTLTRGSTTNVGTTGHAFGLPPFTPQGIQVLGTAMFFDTSASTFLPLTAHSINSTEFVIVNTSGSRISNTVPVVPATGDIVYLNGLYEATS